MVNHSSRVEMSSEARKSGSSHDKQPVGDGNSSRKRYHLRPSSKEVRSKIAELAAFEEEGWCEDCFKQKGKHRKYAHLQTVRECATARERGRMHALNDAFDKLRRVIPNTVCSSEQKLSKIATLRQAIYYISMLANVLNCDGSSDKGNESEPESEPMDKRPRVQTSEADSSYAESSSGTDSYESQSSPGEFLFTEESFGSFWCDNSVPSPGDIPFNEEFQYHL